MLCEGGVSPPPPPLAVNAASVSDSAGLASPRSLDSQCGLTGTQRVSCSAEIAASGALFEAFRF